MYGTRARIGYAAPPFVTEVFPYEFYMMAPEGVTLMITTLEVDIKTPQEMEASHERSVRAARAMADAGADLVIFGGTPVNMTLGDMDDLLPFTERLEKEIGTKVITSTGAQEKAIKALGSKRVAVAHPYRDIAEENDRHRNVIRGFGCEASAVRAADYRFRDLGRVPKEAAMKMARELKQEDPAIDNIHFASAHWPVMHVIDEVENELGLDVMSAHQATVWEAFRQVGITEPIDGYGRLFREF